MQGDFSKALSRVLVYEGGKVDDPHDPGGRTNKGVTQATYNSYLREHSRAAGHDVYLITDAEVSDIYQAHYWDLVRGDDLPAGLDFVVFDGAVNSGCGQSGKWLQRSLGQYYTGVADGLLGPKTLQAVSDFCAASAQGAEPLIYAYCSRRLATLHQNKNWGRYGAGWSARIANGLKIGDAWAAGEDAPHPVDVTDAGGHNKAPAVDQKTPLITQGLAHATTAVGSAGAVASQAADQLKPLQSQLPHWPWVTYTLGGLAAIGVAAGVSVKVLNSIREEAAKGSATVAIDLDADAGHPVVQINDNAPVAPAKAA